MTKKFYLMSWMKLCKQDNCLWINFLELHSNNAFWIIGLWGYFMFCVCHHVFIFMFMHVTLFHICAVYVTLFHIYVCVCNYTRCNNSAFLDHSFDVYVTYIIHTHAKKYTYVCIHTRMYAFIHAPPHMHGYAHGIYTPRPVMDMHWWLEEI